MTEVTMVYDLQEGWTLQSGNSIVNVWDANSPSREKRIAKKIKEILKEIK